MRFPFTFMGAFSIAFGAWVLLYAFGGHVHGSFQVGAAAATGAVLIGFGLYRLALSATRGGQA